MWARKARQPSEIQGEKQTDIDRDRDRDTERWERERQRERERERERERGGGTNRDVMHQVAYKNRESGRQAFKEVRSSER